MRISLLFVLLMPMNLLGQAVGFSGSWSVPERDSLKIDETGYHGPTVLDSVYDPITKTKAFGEYAMDKDSFRTNVKAGHWTEYYANGNLKSEGNYQINAIKNCCDTLRIIEYRTYKIGSWKYYYENGTVKAEGTYTIKKSRVKR